MTTARLERRITALEREVQRLKAAQARGRRGGVRWWIEEAGRFADDPVFDEIVRLGREYRRSLRPKPRGRWR